MSFKGRIHCILFELQIIRSQINLCVSIKIPTKKINVFLNFFEIIKNKKQEIRTESQNLTR